MSFKSKGLFKVAKFKVANCIISMKHEIQHSKNVLNIKKKKINLVTFKSVHVTSVITFIFYLGLLASSFIERDFFFF